MASMKILEESVDWTIPVLEPNYEESRIQLKQIKGKILNDLSSGGDAFTSANMQEALKFRKSMTQFKN